MARIILIILPPNSSKPSPQKEILCVACHVKQHLLKDTKGGTVVWTATMSCKPPDFLPVGYLARAIQKFLIRNQSLTHSERLKLDILGPIAKVEWGGTA